MIEVSMTAEDTLTLTGEASVHFAEELYGALDVINPAPGGVTIDLAGLTALDTVGAQILIAYNSTMPRTAFMGVRISWLTLRKNSSLAWLAVWARLAIS